MKLVSPGDVPQPPPPFTEFRVFGEEYKLDDDVIRYLSATSRVLMKIYLQTVGIRWHSTALPRKIRLEGRNEEAQQVHFRWKLISSNFSKIANRYSNRNRK